MIERWKVSRLDIALISLHLRRIVSYYHRRLTSKLSGMKQPYIMGRQSQRYMVCQYDKQKLLKEVKGIDSLPMTRIEFRLKPKQNLKRKDKHAITSAVKERTVDMLNLFLEYVEWDIDGFMLDGLISPSNSDESSYQSAG